LQWGGYGVEAAEDVLLLLKRGLPPPGISTYSPVQSGPDAVPELSAAFCSFTRVAPQEVHHALDVDFTPEDSPGSSISLVGYSVAPPQSFQVITHLMQVTAYWIVTTANIPHLSVLRSLLD